MDSLQNLGVIFLGGGFGACLRYLLTMGVNGLWTHVWLGTLFVNLLGCSVYFLLTRIGLDARPWVSFSKIGLLGSLTTFSTLSFEVVLLFKAGQIFEGFLVLFLNMFFGVMIGIGILQ